MDREVVLLFGAVDVAPEAAAMFAPSLNICSHQDANYADSRQCFLKLSTQQVHDVGSNKADGCDSNHTIFGTFRRDTKTFDCSCNLHTGDFRAQMPYLYIIQVDGFASREY